MASTTGTMKQAIAMSVLRCLREFEPFDEWESRAELIRAYLKKAIALVNDGTDKEQKFRHHLVITVLN